MNGSSSAPFHPPKHNHRQCAEEALARATEICREKGVRLTPQRRRILELVWRNHRPVGAYQLIDALSSGGNPCAPPTVYRALNFLAEQGLIHRIESLNAFVGCGADEPGHTPQFLICGDCGDVGEVHDPAITDAILSRAGEVGFASRQTCVEVHGTCPACIARGAPA